MLKFSKEQATFILNTRRHHEAQHNSMMAQQGGQQLIGNAAPLPRDVWGEWDREAVELQRPVLAVFNNLAASVSMSMPLAKLIHYFQTVGDSGDVNISLDGQSSAKSDQQLYEYHGTPLPIIDSTFSYGWRQMLAAQSEGYQLDGAGRMNGMRRVAEKLEAIVLDGDASIVVGSSQLYGMRNHPNRGTRVTGVALNGATGAQWVSEIVSTLKVLHANNFRTPATIFLNWDDMFYASNNDFSAQYPNKSILQRIREIEGVQEIVPANSVNASEIFGVVKRRDVVQILNGMPMATRAKFRADPEDPYDFKVMASAALEIKFDAEQNCGIVQSAIA
jgi:hypothetical protein